jgi:hypothetical protein
MSINVDGLILAMTSMSQSKNNGEFEVINPPWWRVDRWLRWAALRLLARRRTGTVTILTPTGPQTVRVLERRKASAQ